MVFYICWKQEYPFFDRGISTSFVSVTAWLRLGKSKIIPVKAKQAYIGHVTVAPLILNFGTR